MKQVDCMNTKDNEPLNRSRQFNGILNVIYSKNIIEYISLFTFLILLIIVSGFHEPWYDEAQSWLIARSAPLKDIFLTLPHYEGHSPLWHMILLPIARSGIPYEIGIKAIAIILSTISAALIIFKAPFPRLIRLLLPFTYFIFYQTGVISRNYSLLLLGFLFAAILYPKRNQKPWFFVLSMALVSAASAYGIVICAGITVAWIIEIYKEYKIKFVKREFIKDERVRAITVLFLFALLMVYMILPEANTYAVAVDSKNSFLIRLLYMLLIAPLEAIIYQYFDFYQRLSQQMIPILSYIVGIITGIMLFISLFYLIRREKIWTLVLPYMCFSIFSAGVHFYTHHISVVGFFFLFWSWTYMQEERMNCATGASHAQKYIFKNEDMKKIKKLGILFLWVCMGMSVYWSVSASIHEITVNYGYGREMADFIEGNNLEKLKIMGEWQIDHTTSSDKPLVVTNLIQGVVILPYFQHNIIFNLNNGNDLYPFIIHLVSDNAENIASWKESGIPDVIIEEPDLQSVYGSEVSVFDYVPVKEIQTAFIWKDQVWSGIYKISVRRDLLSDYPGLEPIEYEYVDPW